MAQLSSVAQAVKRPFQVVASLYKRTVFTLTNYTQAQPIRTLNQLLNWSSAKPESSAIVVAGLRWIQRTFTEAPPIMIQWLPDQEEWKTHAMADILDLIDNPNPFYNGATLWKATLADRIFNGTGYWIKVRNTTTGIPVQLWWAPESTITPVSHDPHVFIQHYEYRPQGGVSMIELPVTDVIRFPDGIDPENPKKGNSAVKSILKEIYTDEEAASMTVSLLKNMGIPGVIISPKNGTIPQSTAESIKDAFVSKTTGDRRGEPLVLEGTTEVVPYGFSPEQMQMRSLRGLPEERICAVIGINVAVLGLGAGLQTTKVGATLREYREEAFESTIIPMYRELSGELKQQLVPDFYPDAEIKNWRIGFDLTQIRVLQDDENKKSEALGKQLSSGGIKISEYRRKLGYQVLPEHEGYLRSNQYTFVPAGMTPEDQAATSTSISTTTENPTSEPGTTSEPDANTQAKRQVVLNFSDEIRVESHPAAVNVAATEVHNHIQVRAAEPPEQELIIQRDDLGRPTAIQRRTVTPSKNGVH